MADASFERFSVEHLAILSGIPAAALLLAIPARRSAKLQRIVPVVLGLLMLALEAGWYVWLLNEHGWGVDYALPLQLTDATILLTAYAAITRHQAVFDVIYYWSLSAMPLALITPDLDGALTDLYSIVFLSAHGLTVLLTLFLVFSGAMRPGRNSMWRSLLCINLFTAFVFLFNSAFGTNYMYLMQKPAQPSPLDWMGPWPVYILVGEVVAFVLFGLLAIPFRNSGAFRATGSGEHRV